MNGSVELLTAAIAAVGIVLWFVAWSRAGRTQESGGKIASRAQVLGGLAGGILTGAVVTFGVLLIQQWLAASSENALWQAEVQTAANIPGFNPGNHPMKGLNLSGKQLRDADLQGKDLTGVELRDTNLVGSDLVGADFHGDIMYSANLSGTDLKDANLSDAQIKGVQFKDARIEDIGSLKGAVADDETCWPKGFLEIAISKGVKAGFHDGVTSQGREEPNC